MDAVLPEPEGGAGYRGPLNINYLLETRGCIFGVPTLQIGYDFLRELRVKHSTDL